VEYRDRARDRRTRRGRKSVEEMRWKGRALSKEMGRPKGATDCMSAGGHRRSRPPCRRGRMGVCDKLPTMDFDLFVDLFFIVRPPSRAHPNQN
jgi:hypothetical protein